MLRRISRAYSCTVRAISPIAHNADSKAGNEPLFRQTRVAQPDGSVTDVPVFSGNAFRGAVIRDPALDWLAELVELPESSLPPKLFHFLGAGGSIEKGETKSAFPVEKINRIRELLPMVGLLGGTWEATSIPGSFRSAFGWPVCAETTHLTDHVSETPARRLLDSPFFTRSGDETSPL